MNEYDSLYQQYHQLLRLRRRYIIGLLLMFFLSITLANLFDGLSWLFLIVFIVYAYISTFIFFAKDICPFCKQSFFLYAQSRVGVEHSFLFSRQCINCKMPHAKKSDDETSS